MSPTSSLRARLGPLAPTEAAPPDRSGSPVAVELRSDEALEQPVSLAKALRRFGLSLREAHAALNALKESGRVRLTLYVSERSGPPGELEGFGLRVRPQQDR